MNCFMGYNPLVAKEVKITTWIKEFDGDSPVYPSFPNEGDCFVVFATDEDALTHNALSKKTYTNGEWADAEGGGGGDFTTAEVTLIPYEGSDFELYPVSDDEGRGTSIFLSDESFFNGASTKNAEPLTVTLVYVGDSADLAISNTYVSSTGAVVYHEDTNTVTVSGDCSITGWYSD